MADCGLTELGCKFGELAGNVVGGAVDSVVGDAIENMANAVMEAFGQAVASLGTVWVHIGTPNLTGTGGGSAVEAGSSAPGSEGLTTVLGWVTWIALAVAVLGLFALGALVASRLRAGEGLAAVGRIGVVLAAVVVISAASALVAALLPDGPRDSGGAVLFLQSSLWWYTGAAAVGAVVIGGARMAWEQRAEPGRETVRALITLVVVAGAGVTLIGLLVAAADSFALWTINGALECDVSADSACFGENMTSLLALGSATQGLGALLIIILGLFAVLASALQIVLMVARGGMLVILAGVLPLSASFTNTEMGKGWFRRVVAWLVAFILYKPAAAIVYAAAFQLVGTDVYSDDGSGLLAVLTGLMLMFIALFAMPALLRFVTPMVGAVAGAGGAGAGAAGALAAGAMAALPTGAVSLGRLASGASGTMTAPASGGLGPGSDGTAGTAGPSGSGQPGPTGPGGGGQQGAGPAGGAGSTAGAGAGAGDGATGAGAGDPAAAAGATGGGSAGSPAATGAGPATGAASTRAGATGAGSAAAGGGAAAAAAGPAGAALAAGSQAARTAAAAARQAADQAGGDDAQDGPDGSR
jgi:hypothetical protein